MELQVSGVGKVTIEELEARFCAHMNAGAPEPKLVGTPAEKKAIRQLLASRGDSQMKSLMDYYMAHEDC